ncbi:MAG: methylenetetrahydrofolate reductase [Chlamydiae bacterium]|nr:methylenetetrahydrofolate reductase [Chlamydiota bacterium]MBI3265808.1 methylenetetrahydrofolate reductase [Chlamydiota bacterium]
MRLRDKINLGQFVVTAELSPPKGPDVSELLEKVRHLKGRIDAANLTDNNRAVMCMSPLAAAALLVREGVEAIMQVTCRDRNRMAIQSDFLGAYALGVRNVLALTGDPVKAGDHPQAKEVFDIDSLHLMRILQNLNQGLNDVGKELNAKTDFCIGAAANPGAKDMEVEFSKFQKKVECGAQFFQTQGVYEIEPFKRFMDRVRAFSPKVIAGIILLKSAKMATFLNEKVPGVHVPASYIGRLEKAQDPIQEGVRIAAETIEALQGVCAGVHLMCIGREDLIGQILELAEVPEK